MILGSPSYILKMCMKKFKSEKKLLINLQHFGLNIQFSTILNLVNFRPLYISNNY